MNKRLMGGIQYHTRDIPDDLIVDVLSPIPYFRRLVTDSIREARSNPHVGEKNVTADLLSELQWIHQQAPENPTLCAVMSHWLRCAVQAMNYLPLYDSWLHNLIHQVQVAVDLPYREYTWSVIEEMLGEKDPGRVGIRDSHQT